MPTASVGMAPKLFQQAQHNISALGFQALCA
jgi:hypothetical protein